MTMMYLNLISLTTVWLLLTARIRDPSDISSVPPVITGLTTVGDITQTHNLTEASHISGWKLGRNDPGHIRRENISAAVVKVPDTAVANATFKGFPRVKETFPLEIRFGETMTTPSFYRITDDDPLETASSVPSDTDVLLCLSISAELAFFLIGRNLVRLYTNSRPDVRTNAAIRRKKDVWYHNVYTKYRVRQLKRRLTKKKKRGALRLFLAKFTNLFMSRFL